MSTAAQATTTETVKTKPAAKSAIPATFYVLDTTAIPGGGKRAHEMMVDGVLKTFEFEPGKGLEMDRFVALKFLNIDAFKRVDEKGNLLPFRRPPKQPHELGAGEQFKLADEETVAHFDELSTPALQHRVTAMPGGELFAQAGSRSDMIAFIVAAKKAAAKANISTSSDMGRDDFLPAPDFDEEAA
jgi:hypothetical protein